MRNYFLEIRELLYQSENDEGINFIDSDFVYDEDGNRILDQSEEPEYRVSKRKDYSQYYINKYTREGGVPLLSYPVVLRLAEMYLIKAEAFAKTGREEEALNMINITRERAGLSGDQLFSLTGFKGYYSMLDEKRLKLV